MTETSLIIACSAPALSSFITYLFMRRKNKADAKGSELDNVDKAVSIWRNLAQELEKEISELKDKVKNLEEAQTRKCENCKYRKHYNETKKEHV